MNQFAFISSNRFTRSQTGLPLLLVIFLLLIVSNVFALNINTMILEQESNTLSSSLNPYDIKFNSDGNVLFGFLYIGEKIGSVKRNE